MTPPVSVLDELERSTSQRSRPAWFDPAVGAVLDGAASITSARDPREVEDRTAALLGAELYRVV